MPQGINNLRIGEAILQGGRDTFLDQPWEELDRDAFLLTGRTAGGEGQAVRADRRHRASMPSASGREFVDKGDRLRGIVNIGREDVIVEGLTPVDRGRRACSAHRAIIWCSTSTDARAAARRSATASRFRMNYGAMLAAMTSEYVEKKPMFDRPKIAAGGVFRFCGCRGRPIARPGARSAATGARL